MRVGERDRSRKRKERKYTVDGQKKGEKKVQS